LPGVIPSGAKPTFALTPGCEYSIALYVTPPGTPIVLNDEIATDGAWLFAAIGWFGSYI
jgi:hypothetical protein